MRLPRALNRRPIAFTLAVALIGPPAAESQAPRAPSDFGVQGLAKILCSAVFVSERELGEALRNSGSYLSVEDRNRLGAHVNDAADDGIQLDRSAATVRVSMDGFTGRAQYFGDQGCVILPPGYDHVFFEPTDVESTLPDPMTLPWPIGDVLDADLWPAGLDRAAVTEAVDAAFEGDGLTASFVAVYQGQIIGERYAQGAGKNTQLESWSMGKSVTATLLGVLAQQGHVGLHDPAPVELWHTNSEDPRSRIKISDLLRMSSGLRFTHASQPAYEWGRGMPDHLYIYAGGIDAFHFSITRPVEFPPNTVGRYRNSDPLTIGYIIRQTVERLGENYLTWPQQALFDRIGIHKQVLEPDPYGNFLLTGYDYGTGRNFARLGLLYLQDGVWNDERILPEGWVEFVSTPAPAWDPPVYGGLFWVNTDHRWNAPASAYYMNGAGGQRVLIVPSHDLVVARQGHRRGAQAGMQALNRALGQLIAAIDERR